jgi:histidyl-tRNA synthetase
LQLERMEMNMVRGTRMLVGEEAKRYVGVTGTIRSVLTDLGFEEVVLPSLWNQETFVEKGGPEIVNQMYAFPDKAGRAVCLHP